MTLQLRDLSDTYIATGAVGVVPPSVDGVTRVRLHGVQGDPFDVAARLGLPVNESATLVPHKSGDRVVVNVDGLGHDELATFVERVRDGLDGLTQVDWVFDNNDRDNPPEWVAQA